MKSSHLSVQNVNPINASEPDVALDVRYTISHVTIAFCRIALKQVAEQCSGIRTHEKWESDLVLQEAKLQKHRLIPLGNLILNKKSARYVLATSKIK